VNDVKKQKVAAQELFVGLVQVDFNAGPLLRRGLVEVGESFEEMADVCSA